MQGVDGVKTIIKEDNTPDLFDFLGRYVHKTYIDDLISKKLRASPGISYLDAIQPSDIAYVIALMKNAREIWDQDLWLSAGGEAVMGNKETKVKPKFTGGKGQKRMKGKNLWNKEGMTYFKRAEKIGGGYMSLLADTIYHYKLQNLVDLNNSKRSRNNNLFECMLFDLDAIYYK
jgi:hypothetical protein